MSASSAARGDSRTDELPDPSSPGPSGSPGRPEPSAGLPPAVLEASESEAYEAERAGAVSFISRAFVLASMPHRVPKSNEISRSNGNFHLSMMAPSRYGLPYGNIPRLLLMWMTTEAFRTRDPVLSIGGSMTGFMQEQLGLAATGGKGGTVTRFKDQVRRLASSSVAISYDRCASFALHNVQMVRRAHLLWDDAPLMQGDVPEALDMGRSWVELGNDFFQEVTTRPVPVRKVAAHLLRRSTLSLDIYYWATHRVSYLTQPTTIPWPYLAEQFGSEYVRLRDFRKNFSMALSAVLEVYPDLDAEPATAGLVVRPSNTHVPKILPRRMRPSRRRPPGSSLVLP